MYQISGFHSGKYENCCIVWCDYMLSYR